MSTKIAEAKSCLARTENIFPSSESEFSGLMTKSERFLLVIESYRVTKRSNINMKDVEASLHELR